MRLGIYLIWFDLGIRWIGKETRSLVCLHTVKICIWGDVLLGMLSCFEKLAVASELDVLLKSKLELKGALS